MRFWDASAVVPLLCVEPSTRALEKVLRQDPAMVAWWGTHSECMSALARKRREAGGDAADFARARRILAELERGWKEVLPGSAVRQTADRLLNTHGLRAADALQLAAALVGCGFEPSRVPFVCGDRALAEAAVREGFEVLPG